MTQIIGQEKQSLDDLAHHGVKGMKWGVRRENRLALNKRVASGKGSKLDTLRVASTQVSPKNIQVSGGVRGAAHNKAQELQARKSRIQKGRASVGDVLALHGGDRFVDTSFRKGSAKNKAVVGQVLKVSGGILLANVARSA